MKSTYFKMLKLNQISNSFYRQYKNTLTKTIRKAKKQYYMNAFEERRRDAKSTWRLLKSVITNKRSKNPINSVVCNEERISDPVVIARRFNDYFSTIAVTLESGIPPPLHDPADNISHSISNSIFLLPVDAREVVSIVGKLKNCTYGLYDIPAVIYLSLIHI